ncbi:Protein of unknown function [Cognatiyoonia koreensis]|uniref:Nucleoside-triphosphatase THEP1 n=1 Tax=Cognatiyoonia koreensis TaxID=364200 RepID=A0A1I0QU40_9RHOB|nr:DUF2478 domain-containing protein [Cognatiyoonia koreensis]SEW31158.1 Protein of unknown function [Cognatiyoonia koreensis]
MNIAYTMAQGRGGIDTLLFAFAQTLAKDGYRTCGTVQINTDNATGPCDMDVRVLPNGPDLRISQNLGAASKGCRLDPMVLEAAVGLVSQSLQTGADILIVNKFGKHEAHGRGFRTVIADALELDVPVLIGVNGLNLDAFKAFVGPDALYLEPRDAILQGWFRKAQTKAQTLHTA